MKTRYTSITFASITALAATLALTQLCAEEPTAAPVQPSVLLAPTTVPQLVVDARGFTDPIHRLVISNDGRYLAGAAGKVVRVWDLQTRTLYATLRGYQEPYGYELGYIDTITFSPDSRHLIVGVSDNYEAGSTRVYDLKEPEKLKRLIHGHLGCTRGTTFSDSGKLFATWGCDGYIIMYDWLAEQGDAKERFRVRYGDFVGRANDTIPVFQFTGDEEFLVYVESCGCGAVELDTQKLFTLDGRSSPPELARFGWILYRAPETPQNRVITHEVRPSFTYSNSSSSPTDLWGVRGAMNEGEHLADAYWAGTWLRNGKLNAIHPHNYQVVSVTWNAKANLAASSDLLGEIHVWNPATGELQFPPIVANSKPIWGVFWDESGTALHFATDFSIGKNWHYNNYGEISSKLDLSKMVLSNSKMKAPWQYTRIDTYVGGSRLTLHRRQPLGKQDLLVNYKSTSDRFVNVTRDFDGTVSGKASLASRRNAFTNPSIRIPYEFKEICFYGLLNYPEMQHQPSFVFGTVTGQLVEGYFDETSAGPEFRVVKKFLGHSSKITGAQVSPDKRYLATSSLDGTIRIWPLQAPKRVGDVDFVADGSSIVSMPKGGASDRAGLLVGDIVQFVGDTTFFQRVMAIRAGQLKPGQLVDVVVSREQGYGPSQVVKKTRLVETPEVIEPALNFFLSRDNEWVLWTPTGHYNSSSNGAQYIGWHLNKERFEPADFFTSDQFEEQLYQPEIVAHTFRTGDPEGSVQRLREEFGPSILDKVEVPISDPQAFARYRPPQVDIVTPARNAEIENGNFSIKARVRIPRQADLRSTQLLIDGRSQSGRLTPVYTGIANESVSDNQRELWFEQHVSLRPGDHRIKLLVETSTFTKQWSEVEFHVKDRGNARTSSAMVKGRLFILSVGLSKYKNEKLNLDYADRDATSFVELWNPRKGEVFSNVISRLLVNERATHNGIKEDGLDWLLDQDLTPDDTVIVFLSGHGFFDRYDEWFFGGHDLNLNRLSTTGVSDAELKSFFSKLPTNAILFTDSCFSGSFELPTDVRKNSRTGKNLWRDQGKIAFLSCLPHEASLESSRWEHGAFTRAILDYFSEPGSDLDNDGYLSATEMALFVKGRVQDLTEGQQNPSHEFPSGISDVIFGRAAN